jgi:hypothetical protein
MIPRGKVRGGIIGIKNLMLADGRLGCIQV